jgi:hypothetical protein
MPKLQSYHQNFIKGVRLIMANRNIDSTKAVAEYIGINYMSMWKIMDGTNKPTVENCIKLLKKGKFNANWLFLNIGDINMQQQTEMDSIMSEIKSIRDQYNNTARTHKPLKSDSKSR